MSTRDPIDNLRIASPCPKSWDRMTGDDRVRFCDLCNLHVYNVARLTRREVAALISKTEGHVCARLYRRVDGTIITKDCPLGLRAIRRHVAKVAGAVFATIMSLGGIVMGQNAPTSGKSAGRQQVTIARSQEEAGTLSGTVVDQNGAGVAGVKVRVGHRGNLALMFSETNMNGRFEFRGLKSGTYELNLESAGFFSAEIFDIKLGDKESATVSVVLQPSQETETVGGLMGDDAFLDTPLVMFTGDVPRRRATSRRP